LNIQRRKALHAMAGAVLVAASLLGGCGGGQTGAGSASLLKEDLAAFAGNGTYWNPAESGTGFFFEAQGSLAVLTYYAYETAGRPTWYSALGELVPGTGGKFHFSGELQRFAGGQSAASRTPTPPTSKAIGAVSVEFDGERAKVQLPGRSFSAEKFYKAGQRTKPTPFQPETGIFWNPAESGRGFTIEVNNNTATVTVFHYADDGHPIWNIAVVPLKPAPEFDATGDFMSFMHGQTLAGPYAAPVPSRDGTLEFRFGKPCKGLLAFPRTARIPVKRFAFGSLPAGAECRTEGIVSPPSEPPSTSNPSLTPLQAHFEDSMLAANGGTYVVANLAWGDYAHQQIAASPLGASQGVLGPLAYGYLTRANRASEPWSDPLGGSAYLVDGRIAFVQWLAPPRYSYVERGVLVESISTEGVAVASTLITDMAKVSLPPRFEDAPAEFRRTMPYMARYFTGSSTFAPGSAYYRRAAESAEDSLALHDDDSDPKTHPHSATPSKYRTIEEYLAARPDLNAKAGSIRMSGGARCWVGVVVPPNSTAPAVCEVDQKVYGASWRPAGMPQTTLDYTEPAPYLGERLPFQYRINKTAFTSLQAAARALR
jgi:hypothetical protein